MNAVSKVDLSLLQPGADSMVPLLDKQTSRIYEGTYDTPAQLRIFATAKNITTIAPKEINKIRSVWRKVAESFVF